MRQCVSECEHQHQWKHHRQINEPKPGHIYLSPHEQSREKNPQQERRQRLRPNLRRISDAILHDEARPSCSSTVHGGGKRRWGIASPASARAERGGRSGPFSRRSRSDRSRGVRRDAGGRNFRTISRICVSGRGSLPSWFPVPLCALVPALRVSCGAFSFWMPNVEREWDRGASAALLLQQEGRSLIQKEPRGTGTPSAGSKDAPGAQDARPRYATKTRCPASREHAPVADSIAIGD